jgi:hypothetical protein
VIVGTQTGSGAPSGVYNSTVAVYDVYSTCPFGSISIRPSYGMRAVLAGSPSWEMALATGSYSNACVGGLNPAGVVIGPAVNSTLPLGSRHAGASTAPCAWLFTCGIVGPATHAPAWLAIGGGV